MDGADPSGLATYVYDPQPSQDMLDLAKAKPGGTWMTESTIDFGPTGTAVWHIRQVYDPPQNPPTPFVGPQTSNTGLTIAQIMELLSGPDDSKALLGKAKTGCGKVTPWFEPAFAGKGDNAASEPVGAYTTLNGKRVWIAKGSILLDPNVVDLSHVMDMLIFELANLSQADKIVALQEHVKTQGMFEHDYQVRSLAIEAESTEIAARILKKNAVKWKITARRGPCPKYAEAVNNGTQVVWASNYYKTLVETDPGHIQNTSGIWKQLIAIYNETHPSAPYGR